MSAASARPVVLATHNDHKVHELGLILADLIEPLGVRLEGMSAHPQLGEPVEDGVTFAENALIKAVAVAEATGLPALADDSGLAVDVLGGSPGIFSARWSGVTGARAEKDAANNALLLAQLGDVRDEHRAGGFVCAAALAMPDGRTVVREGTVRGVIGRTPRGEHGFGYDPLLVLPDGRTLAELADVEKNAISHRGRAFRALLTDLTVIDAIGAP